MYQDKPCVVLAFNLLQDVNILWPIARLVREETSFPIILLVSDNFVARDKDKRWMKELEELKSRTCSVLQVFTATLSAFEFLQSRRGVIIAASESSLNAHQVTHDLLCGAPGSFVRVTLQHGFECAGLVQNREQTIAFGDAVHFAADVVCTWTATDKLTHALRSELAKMMATGPSSLISRGPDEGGDDPLPDGTGLVCENLHSVRMSAGGDFKQDYMDTFRSFARIMSHKQRKVALRPHPGGQYVVRNGIALPGNMFLANDPIYRTDLTRFAYGISAPSSVLIDMVLAGIPTAVWQDPDGTIDADNYGGLTKISSLREWIAFADAAIADPAPFLERQAEFLAASGIIADRAAVRKNYLDLIRGACDDSSAALPRSANKRVLFVANGQIPTLEICFLRPLAALFENGSLNPLLIVEGQVAKAMGPARDVVAGQEWLRQWVEDHQPDIVVFCRYSGPLSAYLVDLLHDKDIPVIYHVDDDLMNVPIEIGEAKFREHNSPERLLSVSTLFAKSDLIYCSTPRLMNRIEELGYDNLLRTGAGHCSGKIYRQPVDRPVTKIGYMGFDHAHDLEMILPDLVRFLRDRPHVHFELFGTIAIPEELLEFGERVSEVLPVRPYAAFLDKLAALDWDIGIAPLENTRFNYYKANNKWVEYTSVAAAVVATAGMSYDECCADDCGILVDGATGWYDALAGLCDDPDRRYRMIQNAQSRLLREYSNDALRRQILDVFDEAKAARAAAIGVN